MMMMMVVVVMMIVMVRMILLLQFIRHLASAKDFIGCMSQISMSML